MLIGHILPHVGRLLPETTRNASIMQIDWEMMNDIGRKQIKLAQNEGFVRRGEAGNLLGQLLGEGSLH